MGIFDITDGFCNKLENQNKMDAINNKGQLGNKLHEQPIVSFIQKDNEQDVIYREQM